MKTTKKQPIRNSLLSLLITLIAGVIYFYVFLPALNPHSADLYVFIIILCLIFLAAKFLLDGGLHTSAGQQSNSKVVFEQDENGVYHINRARMQQSQRASAYSGALSPKMLLRNVPFDIILLCLVVALVGSVSSATLFHATAYYDLMDVQTGDFMEDVAEISYDKIPMLDEASAIQLGKRALGDISSNSSLVSQFEVSSDYSQINYQSQPVRVACLEYGDFIKWFNNQSDGLPGYIIVDMCTQEAKLVQLEDGIKYSPSEYFNRNLSRYLRFQYPTYLFGNVNFEIDEDGNPWWICSRETCTISLFGGRNVIGAVLVNAVTGECTYYDVEDVPSWVDRVYDATLIINQYNYHGTLVNGWLNSLLGQKGVTTTTGGYEGYNYLAMNDDVYLYTGVTSAGSDESIVGFLLVNQRTKETKFYNITGAEEYSAMSSAEGAVQHLGYSATFPILLNISDQPTYFMALKDSAELVKMYAMVSVSDYQITATGSSVEECQENYEALLAENGITVSHVSSDEELMDYATISATVTDIRSAVIDGNTWFYLQLEGDTEHYFAFSAAEWEEVVILTVGDEVTLSYTEEDAAILTGASLVIDQLAALTEEP
ncbi:MAG: CvpA family protein [Clostridiales bacterium]|nr:CvpA family protein [Clostridiales bacterium]